MNRRTEATSSTRTARATLRPNPIHVCELQSHLGSGTVTLLYSSKETRLNNASALKDYLESRELTPPADTRP